MVKHDGTPRSVLFSLSLCSPSFLAQLCKMYGMWGTSSYYFCGRSAHYDVGTVAFPLTVILKK